MIEEEETYVANCSECNARIYSSGRRDCGYYYNAENGRVLCSCAKRMHKIQMTLENDGWHKILSIQPADAKNQDLLTAFFEDLEELYESNIILPTDTSPFFTVIEMKFEDDISLIQYVVKKLLLLL